MSVQRVDSSAAPTRSLRPTLSSDPHAAGRAAHPLAIISVEGSQAEMGAQHGRMTADLGGWRDSVDYYPTMPGTMLAGVGSAPLKRRLMVALSRRVLRPLLDRLHRHRPAELAARSRAYYKALGLDDSHDAYLGVMDAFQNIVGVVGRLPFGRLSRRVADAVPPACSTLMAWGAATEDGRMLHARNFDFPGIGVWERGPTVVFCKPDSGLRYGFVTTRGADVPTVSAFNEAGIGVTVHTRFHRDVRFDAATVTDLGHDIVRKAETLADAIAIAKERPVASSWGFSISSAREKRGISIETSGRMVEVVEPDPGEPFLATTNRYRHPALIAREVTPSAAFILNSDGREASLRRAAIAAIERGGASVRDLQDLLGSNVDTEGVERAAGGVLAQSLSVQSIVIDPERESVHVSVGPCPTGKGPWIEVPWDWDRGAGWELIGSSLEGGAMTDRARAQQAFVEATRIATSTGDVAAMGPHMEEAARLAPEDTTYRFLVGVYRLRTGDFQGGLDYLLEGLEREEDSFRRGQMLLWSARAADALGRSRQAEGLREALLATPDPMLRQQKEAAKKEQRRPWSRSRFKTITMAIHLVDAH